MMESPIVRTASRTGTTADAPAVRPTGYAHGLCPGGCHGYVVSTGTVIGYLWALVLLPKGTTYLGTQRNTIRLKRYSTLLFTHTEEKPERTA